MELVSIFCFKLIIKHIRKPLFPFGLMCLCNFLSLDAAVLQVTSAADDGTLGTLRWAIETYGPGDTIDLTTIAGSTISLSTNLPQLTQDLTIQNSGSAQVTIDGQSQYQIFNVQSGTIALNHLIVSNGLAQGGDGGNGHRGTNQGGAGGAGGGGLGAGGGLFVGSEGNVVVTGVVFLSNTAEGGQGGSIKPYLAHQEGGGGGGLNGVSGVNGGSTNEGGEAGSYGSGGGGSGGNFVGESQPGGNGGFGAGGGGGGGQDSNGDPASDGGEGGFAGGAGHGGDSYRSPPFVGGDGGAGGGGAGLGGAVFVQEGGAITFNGVTFTNNSIIAGKGGNNLNGVKEGGDGQALGIDLFLNSGANINIDTTYADLDITSSIAGDNFNSGGGIAKIGTGTLTLSGVNTYYGTTSVLEGTLIVSGGLVNSLVLIGESGTLKGQGILGSTRNNGVLAPLSLNGTMNISGDYTQGAEGILEIEVAPSGENNIVQVSGNAFLDGTIQVLCPGIPLAANQFNLGQEFLFLMTGGSISGTFSNLSILNPFLNLQVEYGEQGAKLTVISQNTLFNGGSAVGKTQESLTAHLEGVTYLPGSDLLHVITQLQHLPGDELPRTLGQLSPAPFGSFEVVAIHNAHWISSIFNAHQGECECAEVKQCGFGPINLWAAPLFEYITQSTHHHQKGFFSRTYGALGGIDLLVSDEVVLGVGGGYDEINLVWNHRLGDASVDSYFGGLYANWSRHCAYLEFSILGLHDRFKASRHINFQHVDRHAKNHHSGYEMDVRLAGSYDLHWGCVQWKPFASVEYFLMHQKAYKEKHAQSLNLSVNSHHSHIFRSEIGLSLAKEYLLYGQCVVPQVSLSWVHAKQSDNKLNSSLIGQPGIFKSEINNSYWDHGILSAGIQFQPNSRFSFSCDYELEFSSDFIAHDANIKVQLSF